LAAADGTFLEGTMAAATAEAGNIGVKMIVDDDYDGSRDE
jgi:hypothetical protein